jgi:hypothetical protein
MENFEELLSNGNTVYYKVLNDTYYDYAIKLKSGELNKRDEAEFEKLIKALETARLENLRVRIWLGDPKVGEAWNEEYNVIGQVGRSGGSIKIPILMSNSRSMGGSAILTRCVLRIDNIKTHRTIYKHSKFYVPVMTIKPAAKALKAEGYTTSVFQKNEYIANFKSEEAAKRWVAFMNGERYNK